VNWIPPSGRNKVTLRDIAEATGVSVNTVSRAMTGKSDIHADTKQRVLSAARRLGYTPNLMARSLVHGRTRTLGLLVTDCTHPFYATLIRKVEEVASENNYGLLLATSNEDPVKEVTAVNLLAERRIDGLLLSPVSVNARHIRPLLRSLPCVLLARRPPKYRGAFVGTDNVMAAELAMRHLIGLGHRRIALVTRFDVVTSAIDRQEGYRRALKAAGLSHGQALVLQAAQTAEGGRDIVPRLLKMDPLPTAVFAYSDMQAIGILLGLREAGLRVPDDISVVGFDDVEVARYVAPPLTTVAQDTDRIGCLGAELLIEILAGRGHQRAHLLPGSLIVRGSTASPRTTAAVRSTMHRRSLRTSASRDG
jgi:LacI family transcriptional regulator